MEQVPRAGEDLVRDAEAQSCQEIANPARRDKTSTSCHDKASYPSFTGTVPKRSRKGPGLSREPEVPGNTTQERGLAMLSKLVEAPIYGELKIYASSQLFKIGLNTQSSSDLVHDALLAVLQGLEGRGAGRNPREADMLHPRAFINYVKLVIKSLASNMRRHQRCLTFIRGEKIGMDGDELEGFAWDSLETPEQPDRNFAIRDLGCELFRELRRQIPDRLRRLIKAWERDFFWTEMILL